MTRQLEKRSKYWKKKLGIWKRWPLPMERRHVHPTEENGRYARTYGLPQTQRVFTVSPQAASTTKNQRALIKAPGIQMGNSY